LEKIEFDKKLGLYIRQLRKEKTWNQRDLATKMGNPYQNISRLERGEISPTLYWIGRLSEVFEMSLSEFVEGFEQFTQSN
jgi:transcriptional regulator with XRE-family HTH domain